MDPPEWIDGAKFLCYLEAKGFQPAVHSSTMKRMAVQWRDGAQLSVWKADEVLTELDLHISLLPADVWMQHKRFNHFGPYPQETKEEAVALAKKTSIRAVAKQTGISERTVRKWING